VSRSRVAGVIARKSEGNLRVGDDSFLDYSPERIDPGNTELGTTKTPKVVSGRCVPVDRGQYSRTRGVAETPKVVSGRCVPVDPGYLSWRVRRRSGETFCFVEPVNVVNDHMPKYMVRRMQDRLDRAGRAVNGATTVVLGLACKPNTSDARESTSFRATDLLLRRGSEATAIDPHGTCVEPEVGLRHITEVDPGVLAAADIVVLLTDHDVFDLDQVLEHASLVFDARNRLEGLQGRVERL